MEKKKDLICNLIESFLVVIGLDFLIYRDSVGGWESNWNIIFFVGAYFLLKSGKKKTIAKEIECFSLFYAIIYVIGNTISCTGKITGLILPVKNMLYAFIAVYGLWRILRILFAMAYEGMEKIQRYLREHPAKKIGKKFPQKAESIFYAGSIFFCWLPAYFSYYPGMISYDAPTVLYQILGADGEITRLHPPLHTLFFKAFIDLEMRTGINGLALYGIVQMVILAFVLSYVLLFLKRKHIDERLIWIAWGFFALNPVIAVFTLEPTKDVFFSAAFVTMTVLLLDASCDLDGFWKKKHKVIGLVLSITISCLLRNNAVYAYAICIPLMIFFWKKYRAKMCALFGIAFLAYFVVNGPIYDSLGVQNGDKKEMLSVPMMQIASVAYHNGDYLEDGIKTEIDKFIPYDQIEEKYNPRFADPIKDVFCTTSYEENRKEFYGLWGKLFIRYPHVYLSAFLDLNLPSWYQDARAIDPYACRAYIETYALDTEYYPMERQSKLPWLLEHYYEKAANFELFVQKPLISTFFLISTPIWLVLFTMSVLGARGLGDRIWFLMPAVMLWFTYLLGPVSNFRYIFPLHILMIILIVVWVEYDKFFLRENDNEFVTENDIKCR